MFLCLNPLRLRVSCYLWSQVIFTLWLLCLPLKILATPLFINELHYDNQGGDVDEGIEVAGPAGTSLAGWNLQLYNGSNGSVYRTIELNGVIADLDSGFGVLSFSGFSLQNGSPDGLALADPSGDLVQFLSYEGSFFGVGGVADGRLSIDIGAAETTSTPLGTSLQLFGMGTTEDDFQWRPAGSSFGAINFEQHFVAEHGNVPEPNTLFLGIVGLGLMLMRRSKSVVNTASL